EEIVRHAARGHSLRRERSALPSKKFSVEVGGAFGVPGDEFVPTHFTGFGFRHFAGLAHKSFGCDSARVSGRVERVFNSLTRFAPSKWQLRNDFYVKWSRADLRVENTGENA